MDNFDTDFCQLLNVPKYFDTYEDAFINGCEGLQNGRKYIFGAGQN